MKNKKISIWNKIIKSNVWIITEMSENIWLSAVSIRKILRTWNWNIENKEKIINYLIEKNYIREWEYTITEFFIV